MDERIVTRAPPWSAGLGHRYRAGHSLTYGKVDPEQPFAATLPVRRDLASTRSVEIFTDQTLEPTAIHISCTPFSDDVALRQIAERWLLRE